MIYSQALVIRRAPRAGKSGTFVGLASSWSVDRHNTYLRPDAFARSIAAFNAGSLRIPLLHEHNPLEQLGAITHAAETTDGLEVEAQIVLGTALADRVHQLALADAIGLSVGFNPLEDGIEFDADGRLVYTDVDLLEVSAVSVPSNRESFVHTVRNFREVAPADFERLLREQLQMPRRLAAKVARAALPIINGDDAEPEHAPAELAALQLALDGLSRTLKP